MVANSSGCEAVDSETLVHCLRNKSEEEILAINKVGRIVWLGGPGQRDVGESVLITLNKLLLLHGLVYF